MNLKHLNLDRYGIPEQTEIQLLVYLIANELKGRKLRNILKSIGCDSWFCMPDLCELVLSLMGFEDRLNDDLYDFYLELLDLYCEKVNHDNDMPIKEAYSVYNALVIKKTNVQV